MIFSIEEIDIIKESINIGIGKSANSLSEIFNDFIQIEVPEISIELWSKAKQTLIDKFNDYVSVYQDFIGNINGKSYVLFPKESINTILSSLIHENAIDSDLTNDIILELSNIIANNLIGSIGALLDEKITYSLPEIDINKFNELEDKEDYFLVIINTKLRLRKKNITINILIVFSIKSFESFKNKFMENIEKND